MTQKQSLLNRTACGCIATAFMVASLISLATPGLAQNYQVIHTFSGQGEGANPLAGLTPDGHGNFYGTTRFGGAYQHGTVFKMSPHGSSWIVSPLYSFTRGTDGANPAARVVFGPNGSLYGTTSSPETNDTVYNLQPPPNRQSSATVNWGITTLYPFQGLPDGLLPTGDVIFDSFGNLYGAVTLGGPGCYDGCGSIYVLTHSGGEWTKSVAYAFQGGNDGELPQGVLFDSSGNMFGTAYQGGAHGEGTIFELTPSSGGWQETTLYAFSDTGSGGYLPEAGLIEDAAGNFYGGTSDGPGNSGVIFELSHSNGGWTYTVLCNLPSQYDGGPAAPLTMDAAGNLYGTINGFGEGPGGIFKLTHGQNGWTFTSLHDFTGGSDGGKPYSNVYIDANGNLFGTASGGGNSNSDGVVWEITP